MNHSLTNGNSHFLQEKTKEELPLDDILKELLEEQSIINSSRISSADAKRSLPSALVNGTLVNNIGTSKSQTSVSWQVSQTEPNKSRVVVQSTVATPAPGSKDSSSFRSPMEHTFNKWSLSKPHMWSSQGGQNDMVKEEPRILLPSCRGQNVNPPGQNFSNVTCSAPIARVHSPDLHSPIRNGLYSSSFSNGKPPRQHDIVGREQFSGYRNCSSDSEDPMSWLEEQHSKLRFKRDGTMLRQRSQQEKKLLSELKVAQNTLRKQSQSDTEDFGQEDHRGNCLSPRQNNLSYFQSQPNKSTSSRYGWKDQTNNGACVMKMAPGRICESSTMNNESSKQDGRDFLSYGNQSYSASQNARNELTRASDHVQNGQDSGESSQQNGLTSTVTLKRGDSSRAAMTQAYGSSFPTADISNLDDLERSLKLRLHSLKGQQQNHATESESQQKHLSSEMIERDTYKEGIVSIPKTTSDTSEPAFEEVITLRPIGHGVHNLESQNSHRVQSPTSFPVQVVVSPCPLSPVTPYENQGSMTVKRQVVNSMSVPLSLSSLSQDPSPPQSAMSTLSATSDSMTHDLQQQQQLVEQQLLQQQIRQQQLQQQLQELQHLQQQNELLWQQLREQQQQVVIDQQKQEPKGHQTSLQQLLLKQQWLQQQQLLLQQHLQQQQVQQQLKQDLQFQSQQQMHEHEALKRSVSSPEEFGNVQNHNVSLQVHRMLNENQFFNKEAISESENGMNIQHQSWLKAQTATIGNKQKQPLEQNVMQLKTPQHQTLRRVTCTQQPDIEAKQQLHMTTANSSGHQVIEDMIKKVHVEESGGDRGIPPLESVFGLQNNKPASQLTFLQQQQQQQQSQEQCHKESISVATALLSSNSAITSQDSQKSPSSSVGSGQGLQSPSKQFHIVPSGHNTVSRTLSSPVSPDGIDGGNQTPRFVRDTSKYWHKPNITRDEVIAFLKDKPPGSFIIRNSKTFQGAYGLAVKVAQIPPNVQMRSSDIEAELVRHFLIESTLQGVRLKGCSNEPTFGSLAALVYQHSITALALPCKLTLPEIDASDVETTDSKPTIPVNNESSTQETGCNVLYIGSVDLESLTGPEAISRAIEQTFSASKIPPKSTEVHFKVTSQGITLTDNKRRLFFRRHYPANTITHCSLDGKDRKLTVNDGNDKIVPIGRVLGFVARKTGNTTENACHLFTGLDPSSPATAIVNCVTKVMINCGSSAES